MTPGLALPPPLGIMADSHGRPETIAAAAACLRALNCSALYHLGDICDSGRPGTAQACIEQVVRHAIFAVRGNNDHTLALNLGASADPGLLSVAAFLQGLPAMRRHDKALFAHSLPFVDELGPAALIGSMGPDELARCFDAYPHTVLFRGHSHAPRIEWAAGNRLRSLSLAPGRTVDLRGKLPCVVTCGALTRGVCLTWSPNDRRIACHAIRVSP